MGNLLPPVSPEDRRTRCQCGVSFIPVRPWQRFCSDNCRYGNKNSKLVKETARRCAEMLETEGVFLDIVPGETKSDHAIRFARAFAQKIRHEFGLSK